MASKTEAFCRVVWLMAAALVIFLVGCGAGVPTRTPLDLTIVHTNDTWGYLEPCG
jgi:2',3'-cyclic-nucleotide 2'-phosphodiesterase (5'-nucleotidase family)